MLSASDRAVIARVLNEASMDAMKGAAHYADADERIGRGRYLRELARAVREEAAEGLVTRHSAGRCRVYWGSHGCMLDRGHEGEHLCDCTFDGEGGLLPHMYDSDNGNVGRAPYYGHGTHFYGEDADA
jgi:hypothetical protein